MSGTFQSLAQVNPDSEEFEAQQAQLDSVSVPDLELDTFNFNYFYPSNIDKEFAYQDTTMENFQNYDPARLQRWDHATTGNLGGAHFPFVYQPVQRKGFEVGFRQFELYKIQYEQFAFYRLRKAFTKLNFTQGKTQQDTYSQATFARNFSGGINLSVDFKRMNHQGQYENQTAENTSFAVGLWYKSPSRRYDAFLSFVSNSIFQEENGGIDFSLIRTLNFQDAFFVPTKLSGTANTAHTERAVHYHQRFLFNKQRAPKRKAPPVEPDLLPLDSNSIILDSMNMDSLFTTKISSDSIRLDSLGVPIIDSLIGKTNPSANDSVTIRTLKTDSITNLSIDSGQAGNTIDSTKTITTDSILVDTFPPSDSIRLDSLGFPIVDTTDITRDSTLIVYEGATPFKKRKRDFALTHHGTFQIAKYRFSDTSPAADSSFYGNLQKDNRGLRYFIRNRKLENTFTLNTTKVVDKGTSKTKNQKDFFEVGLRHAIHFVFQEPRDTIINNLFLQGRWNVAPTERMRLETYADFGLVDNAGDYHVHGNLFVDLKQAGEIEARVAHQSYSPTLMEHQHLISQQTAWKNNFNKTFETNVQLSYRLPRFKLELIGQYHLIYNFIYFNSQAVPEQFGNPLSIGQLTLIKEFKVGAFHLYNRTTVQQLSRNVIRLPELYSFHSLYYQGRWFKKRLRVQIGTDLRINTPYEAMGYQPAIGQFYLEDYVVGDLKPWSYPAIDFFINIRVKTFRFFFKQENFINYFAVQPADHFSFQVKGYGQPYAYLRFGASWQFLD
ncbi:MAG: putative porin [Saprospiraceae bacterium]